MEEPRYKSFREKVAAALDDDRHTRVWHNYVDYAIIAMILLSTAEIFVSTFEPQGVLKAAMRVVDIVTLVFFTIEVSLRIWVAPALYPSLSAGKARWKHCLSFYGLIDLLSTYPIYFNYFIPLPYTALKGLRLLRVVRIFRLTRYSHSFTILATALHEKRHMMVVSLQVIVVITLVLSLMLYFCEHAAQPEAYNNGFASTIWAFAQYIGDPGGFAETPPVTLPGRIIACLVGLMGIALFAVPTGILGSGFTEAMEEDEKRARIERDSNKLVCAFERKLDRVTGLQIVPPFRSIDEVKARMNMKESDIIEAVEAGANFRLINLANTLPLGQINTDDRLAVEHFSMNRPYGCCIDRSSSLTIISPASMADPCVGNFAFYLALLGGFNYVSREVGERAPYKSFFLYGEGANDQEPGFAEYAEDISRLLRRTAEDGSRPWGITVLVSSGAMEPTLETNLHLEIGGKKGDERTSGDDLFIRDEATYLALREQLTETLKPFDMTLDHQRFHNTHSPNNFIRRMGLMECSNNVVMRIEWEKILWSYRRIELAAAMANSLAQTITHTPTPPLSSLPKKDIGFRGYGV